MAGSHQQAYFDDDAVLAASPELDAERLRDALPGGDGVRASTVDGIGLVVARRAGDFAHAVVEANGTYPVELALLDEPSDELEDVASRPVDLGFLADAPPGVATRLLDAALAGPVVFTEPDARRRADWVAWLSYALPDGASLTFSTAGDEDVRVRVADEPGAIDTSEPVDLTPSFYARVALELALRGELRAAVAAVEEPDGLALAVHGGATDLISPHQLPLALQLITELATAGRVREAARAAAALPTGGPSTALVVREEPALPELVSLEPEEEEIPEADVVEPEPLEDDEIIVVPFEPAPVEAPEREPEVVEDPAVIREDEVIVVPFEVDVEEPAQPEEPADEPLPDQDAWSNLLSELKAESVAPDASLPVLPEPEPPGAQSYELGITLDAFAASLKAAPEPQGPDVELIEEQEVGMSLAELEESLKRERDA